MNKFVLLASLAALTSTSYGQALYNGLNVGLSNLYRLSDAVTRSIGPENPTGGKGRGGMATIGEGTASKPASDLGQGWKVNPFIRIGRDSTYVLADIKGPGEIQHIWMTPTRNWKLDILKIYWDGEKHPSVEVPVGDFFACGWGKYCQINSLPICVNPRSGLNSYWKMPFRKECKITMTNLNPTRMVLYYEVDYTLTKVPKNIGYFCAQFRTVNAVPYKHVYTIVDSIRGKGEYVGTYLAWSPHSDGWWGEGEIKFYIDGDVKFPTICGTGTEDYFGGSYGFDHDGHLQEFSTPYSGMPQVIAPNGVNTWVYKIGMYRWHIMDPIRFDKSLRVTIQDLGWQEGHKYQTRQDDISSVAYWYQTEPHHPFPKFPSKHELIEN